MVGERGPELEYTGRSTIFSNSQAANLLGAANAQSVGMLQSNNELLRMMLADTQRSAIAAEKTARNTEALLLLMRRVSNDGEALLVEQAEAA